MIVDEAHATGALGPGGRGAAAAAGLSARSTCSSARWERRSAATAHMCAATREIASYLVNTARTLIFSTGPPPPSVAAALAALELLPPSSRASRAPARNAAALRDGPRRAGLRGRARTGRRSCRWCWATPELRRRGVRAGASSAASSRRRSGPPPCPQGSSRLRLAAMATHTAARARVGGGPARRGRPRGRRRARRASMREPARADLPLRRRARRAGVRRAA